MRWLLWFLPVRLFLWGLTLFLTWQIVVFVRSKPQELDARLIRLLDQTATELVRNLGEDRGTVRRIGMVHFVNDPTDQVTLSFSRAFSAPAAWSIEERSVIQRFLSDIGRAVAKATTPEEVVFAGRQVDLDWVVMGRVHQLTAGEEEASIAVSVWIYDLGRGEWRYRERLSKTDRSERDLAALTTSLWSRASVRVVSWILLVAMLPWLTAPLIYRVIEHKSNLLSAILLGGYVAVDLLLMLALMGFDVSGRNPAVWMAVALLVVTIYNFWACEKIAEATR